MDETKSISAIKQKKVNTVTQLNDKIARSKAVVLTNYQGLTHKQLEELRKIFKKSDSEFKITKNNLLKRALLQAQKEIPDEHLNSPTATLFSYSDVSVSIKELAKFFKSALMGKIKIGILGNKLLSKDDLEKFATLPSHKELIAQLIGRLQSPIFGFQYALTWNLRKLIWTLNAVKGKKS